jgi:hypothetical protein
MKHVFNHVFRRASVRVVRCERIARLRTEINEFRSTVLQVLATDSSRWIVEARSLLRHQIMPRREGAIRVADEVQALNRSAFVQQQNDIASVYRATQRLLWGSFGVAVLVSLGIALLATTYAVLAFTTAAASVPSRQPGSNATVNPPSTPNSSLEKAAAIPFQPDTAKDAHMLYCSGLGDCSREERNAND